MKKFVMLLLIIAIVITSIITIHNIKNSEWQTVSILSCEILDSKNAVFTYNVTLYNGEIHNFSSSKQWTDDTTIKVLVRATKNGVKAIRGKSLTKSEKAELEAKKAAYAAEQARIAAENAAKEAYNNIIELVTAHLEYCETTNCLNDRLADSNATIAAIDSILESYPNGFEGYEFFDTATASEYNLALTFAKYVF